jgi:hypothetical protein
MTLTPMPAHWVYETSIRFLHGDNEGALLAADRANEALLTLPAWRAAALADLGRHEEAKREVQRFFAGARETWVGDQEPTDAMIGRWFMQVYPIGDRAVWQRLRDGVAAVGIPVAGLTFHG